MHCLFSFALAFNAALGFRLVQKRAKEASLQECLSASPVSIIFPTDERYDEARLLVNRREDLTPAPLAIVRPVQAEDIGLVVSCAASASLQVCASDGLHGWDNKAGCTDGVMIQCAGLLEFSVDQNSKQVTLGSGWWLGGLYYHLHGHGLFLPAGSVNSVGITGFTLGCGRGHASFMYGLGCDNVLSVEYVDAAGRIQIADNVTNPDMFWMAKGGGGEFPGVVTKFRMQAYTMPSGIWERKCDFPAAVGKDVVRKWLQKLPEMEDPARQVFTSNNIWDHGTVIIKVGCLGCHDAQQGWANQIMDEIIAASHNVSSCTTVIRQSWVDQVLYESGASDGAVQPPTLEGLLDRTNGWGVKPTPQASLSSGRVGSGYEMSDELWAAITAHVFGSGLPPWTTYLGWYPIGGPKVEEVSPGASVYGTRSATWSIHYKDHIAASSNEETIQTFKARKRAFQAALDLAGLPCKNFYNYIDSELSCATTRDEWLGAYFNDVPRVMSIKQHVDPNNVIRTRTGCTLEGDCRQALCCFTPALAPSRSLSPAPSPMPVPSCSPEGPDCLRAQDHEVWGDVVPRGLS